MTDSLLPHFSPVQTELTVNRESLTVIELRPDAPLLVVARVDEGATDEGMELVKRQLEQVLAELGLKNARALIIDGWLELDFYQFVPRQDGSE